MMLKIFLYVMIKKRNYYLITIKGNKKVNLKEFRKSNNRPVRKGLI